MRPNGAFAEIDKLFLEEWVDLVLCKNDFNEKADMSFDASTFVYPIRVIIG